MADKPRRLKYFTPPRWSVFQTQEHAVDDCVEKSRRKRYFPPVETETSPGASGSSLRGGLEVNCTFSIEDNKLPGTHFTQHAASGEETQSRVSSTVHTLSFIGEHELKNPFCLPRVENETFCVDTDGKCNSQSVNNQASEVHAVTKQTGKSTLQEMSIIGEHELQNTFCLPQDVDATFSIAANDGKSNSKSTKRHVFKPHGMVTRQTGRLLRNSCTSGLSLTETSETDIPMHYFTPSASSSPTRKRTRVEFSRAAGRLFQAEESCNDVSALSAYSQSGRMDDTFTLAHGSISQHVVKESVSERDEEVLISASKGKDQSSVMLATGDSTFEVRSDARDFKMEINALRNCTDLELSHARCRDVRELQDSSAIKVEKNFTVLPPTKSPQNCFRRTRRVSHQIKANLSNSHLQSSNVPFMEGSRVALPLISENSATCNESDVHSNCKSPAQLKTANKTLNTAVAAVGILPEQLEASSALATLPIYFSHAVLANVTVDKENLPKKQQLPATYNASHKIQAKSKIPVPIKQSTCKEKFVSKIPIIFKFKKAGLGSNKETAATKQQSADKVVPFQFTAKPVTFANKPTGQARAFASHRAEAAAQRRMTARSVVLKTAPRDGDGKTLKHQKLYHEMVRVNRAHELMKRRKI